MFRISNGTCYVAVVIAKSGLLAVELLRNTVGVVYRTPVPRFTPPGPAARPGERRDACRVEAVSGEITHIRVLQSQCEQPAAADKRH